MPTVFIGRSVRSAQPKAIDDPNLDAKFKQEVHNRSVRDHDGVVEERQRSTDQLIEDLTLQLNASQFYGDIQRDRAERYRKKYHKMAAKWVAEFWKNKAYENTRWNRFKRWCKRQWEADIYADGPGLN